MILLLALTRVRKGKATNMCHLSSIHNYKLSFLSSVLENLVSRVRYVLPQMLTSLFLYFDV